MATTKKIVKEYTQKEMRRKLRCFTKKKKNQLNTKEDSSVGSEGQKKYKAYRKQTAK